MGGSEFTNLDFGGYLYGMFFAGGFMMACYGVIVGVKSVKGVGIPLAIASAMVGYFWWEGELGSLRSNLFW